MATFTAAELAALEANLATGTERARFSDGREVQYRSLEDLMRIRALIRDEVAGKPLARISLVKFTRD